MKKYEIMYILKADLDENARKEEISKLQAILEAQKAKVTNVNEWGIKDFAYPIKKMTKGYYVVLKVSADGAGLKEFSRLAKLDQNVVRHLITTDQD
jgi:small subunit ribosomal protein S6